MTQRNELPKDKLPPKQHQPAPERINDAYQPEPEPEKADVEREAMPIPMMNLSVSMA